MKTIYLGDERFIYEDLSDLKDELIKKQEILHYIDATPDENYVIRILQAYRVNCDTRWATSSDGTCDNPLFQAMNEHQIKRAELLDKAINYLSTLTDQIKEAESEDEAPKHPTSWRDFTMTDKAESPVSGMPTDEIIANRAMSRPQGGLTDSEHCLVIQGFIEGAKWFRSRLAGSETNKTE